jgi:hypothetical protein
MIACYAFRAVPQFAAGRWFATCLLPDDAVGRAHATQWTIALCAPRDPRAHAPPRWASWIATASPGSRGSAYPTAVSGPRAHDERPVSRSAGSAGVNVECDTTPHPCSTRD